MKIAILGSRGIPNNYGGFEQFAEIISARLVALGHEVTVYNPFDHPYKSCCYKGVIIRRIFSNEKALRFLDTFVFDFLSLQDALRSDYDVILELGYHPASLFFPKNKKHQRPALLTHMAGMEWQRSKWNPPTRRFIRFLEKRAVERSNGIISDNLGIKEYFEKTYGSGGYFLTYGAELFDNPDESVLKKYMVQPQGYYMLIARFQRDNKIELTIDGYIMSGSKEPILIVGGYKNSFGSYLISKYKQFPNVRFLGGIYDYSSLCSLRWYAKLYFHVHSCGGTNPSLLEAMASNAYIASYDNQFNRSVLGDNAQFFHSASDVCQLILNHTDDRRNEYIAKNRQIIASTYNWDVVTKEYEKCFLNVIAQHKAKDAPK